MSNFCQISCPASKTTISLHKASLGPGELDVLNALCDGQLNKNEFIELIQASRPEYEIEKYGTTFWHDLDRTSKIFHFVTEYMNEPEFFPLEELAWESVGHTFVEIDALYSFSERFSYLDKTVNIMFKNSISKQYVTYQNFGWQIDPITNRLTPGLLLNKNIGFVSLNKFNECPEPLKLDTFYKTYFEWYNDIKELCNG